MRSWGSMVSLVDGDHSKLKNLGVSFLLHLHLRLRRHKSRVFSPLCTLLSILVSIFLFRDRPTSLLRFHFYRPHLANFDTEFDTKFDMGKLRSKDGWSVIPAIISPHYTSCTLRLSITGMKGGWSREKGPGSALVVILAKFHHSLTCRKRHVKCMPLNSSIQAECNGLPENRRPSQASLFAVPEKEPAMSSRRSIQEHQDQALSTTKGQERPQGCSWP